jgi:hypothetical protein
MPENRPDMHSLKMSKTVLKCDLCPSFVVKASEVNSKKVKNVVKTHLENNHRVML